MGKPCYNFMCPGCGRPHYVDTGKWRWNGDVDSPTVSPSIVVNPDDARTRCHFYIRGGQIEYLPDSWHELRGLVTDLPEIDAA